MNFDISHTFTKSEVREAEHIFKQMLIKYFGEIWSPKSDGQYVGKFWDCRSMIAVDAGLWRLCQAAKHAGAVRAFGRIETKDVGSMLRFTIFFEKLKEEKSALIV